MRLTLRMRNTRSCPTAIETAKFTCVAADYQYDICNQFQAKYPTRRNYSLAKLVARIDL